MRPALAAALLLATGCASTPRQPPPPPAPPGAPEVRAVRVREPIIVDGVDNDAAWSQAPETEVLLEGGNRTNGCRLRAAVFRGTLYLLVGWGDSTETRVSTRILLGVVSPFEPMGDALRVTWPITGPFPFDPTLSVESSQDIWQWDANVTDPLGHAKDGLCECFFPKPESISEWALVPTGRRHLGRDLRFDEGTSPEYWRPSGSAADVLARGRWREGRWTVELARALQTGHPDDRDLSGLLEIPLLVETFDTGAGADKGRSPVLRLLLPPTEAPPADPPGPVGTGR